MIPMKKTFLALALAAGLTSFAGSAKAQTFSILNTPATSNNGSSLCLSWDPVSGFSTADNGGNWLYLNSPYVVSNPPFGIMNYYGKVTSWSGNPNSITLGEVSAGTILDNSTMFSSMTSFQVKQNETDSYFGINYSDGSGNTNYGWVEFSSTSTSLTIQEAAMNTVANQSITVGAFNQSIPQGAVPEPSTYALFGIGAIGMLMVMRRKKTA